MMGRPDIYVDELKKQESLQKCEVVRNPHRYTYSYYATFSHLRSKVLFTDAAALLGVLQFPNCITTSHWNAVINFNPQSNVTVSIRVSYTLTCWRFLMKVIFELSKIP